MRYILSDTLCETRCCTDMQLIDAGCTTEPLTSRQPFIFHQKSEHDVPTAVIIETFTGCVFDEPPCGRHLSFQHNSIQLMPNGSLPHWWGLVCRSNGESTAAIHCVLRVKAEASFSVGCVSPHNLTVMPCMVDANSDITAWQWQLHWVANEGRTRVHNGYVQVYSLADHWQAPCDYQPMALSAEMPQWVCERLGYENGLIDGACNAVTAEGCSGEREVDATWLEPQPLWTSATALFRSSVENQASEVRFILDGLVTTSWRAQAPGHAWIMVNLMTLHRVTRIRLTTVHKDHLPKLCDFEFATRLGLPWKRALRFTTKFESFAQQFTSFNQHADGRLFKLVMLSTWGDLAAWLNKFEVFGKDKDSRPLGLADGRILDEDIVVSSQLNLVSSGVQGRLQSTGWIPAMDEAQPWFAVSLWVHSTIVAIETKGSEHGWVTSYSIDFSDSTNRTAPMEASAWTQYVSYAGFDPAVPSELPSNMSNALWEPSAGHCAAKCESSSLCESFDFDNHLDRCFLSAVSEVTFCNMSLCPS